MGLRHPAYVKKNLSMTRDFFRWAVKKGKLNGDPTAVLDRRKARGVERTVFTASQEAAIIASQPKLRDRRALRILFHTGIRKGALQQIQFKHFDFERLRLTVFTKGGKVRQVPMVDPHIWRDLGAYQLAWQAHAEDYLMAARKSIFRGYDPLTGKAKNEMVEYRVRDGEQPTATPRPMSDHGIHDWWYGCLQRADVVPAVRTSGERMHKARHTAGQRLLDRTSGNLKAVQALLGHADIGTTGNIYVDWDIYQLETVMRDALPEEPPQ